MTKWQTKPGKIVLLSSGETTPVGGQVYEQLLCNLDVSPRVRVLETPAGFELNSPQVAGRVADYIRTRLQNYQPDVTVLPARARNSAFSTDDPDLLAPLLTADMVYLGAGSPTYTVRQLAGSLAWEWIQARHRLGAALVFASAAAIACGTRAIPVYEIFKVGEDPHWKPGLDLMAAYGLRLVVISHWNNAEGGADVDTSRCFVGQTRFDSLLCEISDNETILGLDEQTAVIIDLGEEHCRVIGRGGVHLIHAGQQTSFYRDQTFAIQQLGDFRLPAHPDAGLRAEAWQTAEQVQTASRQMTIVTIPPQVQELVDRRQLARDEKNWALSDTLRLKILEFGYRVQDTPAGPKVEPR